MRVATGAGDVRDPAAAVRTGEGEILRVRMVCKGDVDAAQKMRAKDDSIGVVPRLARKAFRCVG